MVDSEPGQVALGANPSGARLVARRGTRTVVFMLALAVLAILASIYYQHRSGRNAIVFWTPPVAQLIGQAKQVDLIIVGRPSLPDGNALPVNAQPSHSPLKAPELAGVPFRILAKLPQQQVKGLVHLRRGLLFDPMLSFPSQPATPDRDWRYVLRFTHKDQTADVAITADGAWIANLAQGQEAQLKVGNRFARVLQSAIDGLKK